MKLIDVQERESIRIAELARVQEQLTGERTEILWQSLLTRHINPPYQPTLSTQFNPPYQYPRPTHSLNTPYQHNLLTHGSINPPINTLSYQPTLL